MQSDLFEPNPQFDLFGDMGRHEDGPKSFGADPEKVRRDLQALLIEVKAAQSLPWSRVDLRYHQTVFPQMSRWLPEEEARQLCFEFFREIERLLAA